MARFLLSEDSSYCLGGIFTVDGGLTSGRPPPDLAWGLPGDSCERPAERGF